MRDKPALPGKHAARALHSELHQAGDEKIRRIAAMLDEISDATGKQAILDPLRARLRRLKTIRPLRFPRLLFMPFEPLIVEARDWKPGQATVPRTVLTSIAHVVRAGLGAETATFDAIIAGHRTDEMQVVTEAGEVLWPRAAQILAASSAPPADWSNTGVRDTAYQPLVRAIAAVLRRAPRLRCLLRDADVAALDADERAIAEILRDITDEPAEGCAMIAQLILLQSPRAAPLLRRSVTTSATAAQRALLSKAIAHGTEQALTQMESETGVVDEIERIPLTEIGDHVRRITAVLREIGQDTGGSAHTPRLKAIRTKLDEVCRSRFADGLSEGLIQPLTAGSAEVDPAGQIQMEMRARDLRKLETVVRTVGGSSNYDELLLQASETVQAASAAGRLTPARKYRLVEILSGPEVATALYRKEAQMSSGPTAARNPRPM